LADYIIENKLLDIALESIKRVLLNKLFTRPLLYMRSGFVLKERTICHVGSLKFGTAKTLKEGECQNGQWNRQMV
jgi:hypothetical protein